MPRSVDPTGAFVIDCGLSLDITRADRLLVRLREALGQRGPVVLDTGQVQRVDAVGLHLLTSFLQQARTAGIEVRWPRLGPCLEESVALLKAQPAGVGAGER